MNVFCKTSLALLFMALAAMAAAADELQVEVLGQDFSITHFPAEGYGNAGHLVLWISPGFGNNERTYAAAKLLAQRNVEVWHVDLLDNLFIPRSTNALRELDGRYVAALITQAHKMTGRKVTLLTRAYGALPVLRGARLWQQQQREGKEPYLTGAILFSPEFYAQIPPLGLDPVYDPIASATNIPIMFYQAGKRGNRWQLDNMLERLEQGGAAVYLKILPGVTGVFYHEDIAMETYEVLNALPSELPRVIRMLERTPMPAAVAPMTESATTATSSLDHTLRPYRGDFEPLALTLESAVGDRVSITDYTGKVTVVNFWASWCRPCVEEIPALNRLRKHMQGRPFELVSVNYAETPQQIREFMTMVDVDFPVLLDEDGRYTAKWKVLVYPSTFVISPDGRIAYGVNGAIEWDSPEVIARLEALLPN